LLPGLLAIVPTVVLGGALIAYGARRQWEREAPLRLRDQIVELLLGAVERALDPEPRVSLDGLRLLSMLRDANLLEPEDEDFVEEIARVVMATRLWEAPDDAPLVLGTEGGVRGARPTQVVLPHELLAALLAMDIATARGRPPHPLAWRVVNASGPVPAVAEPPVDEPPPLKRTA
jgi:hypothetical protein